MRLRLVCTVGALLCFAGAGTLRSTTMIELLDLPLNGLGPDGYAIRSIELDGKAVTIIAANENVGAIYCAFTLLRLLQTGDPASEERTIGFCAT